MIILQVFVSDKTSYLVLRRSTLVHPRSSPSVHTRVHFFKVQFFVNCFPTMPLYRTKLKHWTKILHRKLKAYEKIRRMIKLGAIYIPGQKGSFLGHRQSGP